MEFCRRSPTTGPTNQLPLGLTGPAAVDIRGTQQPESVVSSSTQMSPSTKSPPEEQVQQFVRQNQVGSFSLHGVNIVSLVIDGAERLCLAQISNTLLKDFSYNEIHNRRVALGITCVQCTPVQLEILRRAGAMPISSRRCGMITKRESERLVKSFLEDTTPPKLPDNFAFNVKHNCGWGCQGNFVPSRYNSSRAKCIKCTYCNIFFSPNKFIFHFHRTPESKYKHPDAANFNSWRRHITLDYDEDNVDLSHAWEDVKAMFNGGSRKRLGATSPGHERSSNRSDISVPKRSRMEFPMDERSAVTKMPRLPYPYPIIPPMSGGTSVPSMCPTGFIPRVPHPAFPFSPQGTTTTAGVADPQHFQQDSTAAKLTPNFADFWKNKGAHPYYNPLGLLWAKNFGIYGGDAGLQYGNPVDLSRQGGQKLPTVEDTGKYMHNEFMKLNGCFPTVVDPKLQMSFGVHKDRRNTVDKYMSAFRPVNKDGTFEDYKQLRVSTGSDEIEPDAVSPNGGHSENSDGSAYDFMEEQAAVDQVGPAEPDDADINVTDIEQIEVRQPQDINKNNVNKIEIPTENCATQAAVTVEKKENDDNITYDEEPLSLENSNDDTNKTVDARPIENTVSQHSISSVVKTDDTYSKLFSQDDLHEELKKLVEERQKAEKEYQTILDAFKSKCPSDPGNKEDMEHTIKEAHEALRHFSCKMMSLRSTIDYAKLGAMHE